jgi:hypothetical protein
MPYKQIAVVTEGQTQQFDRISQVKAPFTIDRFLMVLDFLFGCWHRNRSRPFTLSGWTYEVCLNCGRKFTYERAAIVCRIPQPRKS